MEGQDRQCLAARQPGQRRQQHEAEPAKAACLDEMAVAGARGVAVDAAGADVCSPAPLDGVIQADDDGFSLFDQLRHQIPGVRVRLASPPAACEYAGMRQAMRARNLPPNVLIVGAFRHAPCPKATPEWLQGAQDRRFAKDRTDHMERGRMSRCSKMW